MEFAFLNIILNAAEAMPNGGEVYLTTEERSGFAHVYVQDHGMGIGEEMREKIFDPFFTTKGGSHRGLGLSFANAIIARHGGEIGVMSQMQHGSIFMVRLPLARQIASSKNKTTKNWFQHSHILIMTDEGVISDLLSQLFVSKGATVSTASTVGEALGLLKKPSIHLMIIDAKLLRTNAGRILSRIRERTGDRPIVLFNAQTKRMSSGALKKMGADLAIGRPLDIDRILHLVSGALQRRKTAG
jgi:sensor histidine kinase regulating citrate/malate metabolism